MAFSYFYCKNFKQSIDALGSRLHSTAKGVALLCIVLLYYDAALEVNLHAGVTDDDLLDHLLHDDSVIYVHDCAGLDVFLENRQPCSDFGVPHACCLQRSLLLFKRIHLLFVAPYLRCSVCLTDCHPLLCLVQLQRRCLQVDDLLFNLIESIAVIWLHD